MEQPIVKVFTAAHTVDYLGRTHEGTEVKKELASFRSKCREEHEKPEYLASVVIHNKRKL